MKDTLDIAGVESGRDSVRNRFTTVCVLDNDPFLTTETKVRRKPMQSGKKTLWTPWRILLALSVATLLLSKMFACDGASSLGCEGEEGSGFTTLDPGVFPADQKIDKCGRDSPDGLRHRLHRIPGSGPAGFHHRPGRVDVRNPPEIRYWIWASSAKCPTARTAVR